MRPIITLCLLLLGTSVAFAEGDYVLTLNHVSVEPTRANGKSWDVGTEKSKAPDLFVTISVNGAHVLQAELDENLSSVSPKLNTKEFDLSGDAQLEIFVFDKDSLGDDSIGKIKSKISPEKLGQVSYSEGAVKKLDLTLALTRAGREALARKAAEAKIQKVEQKAQAEAEKREATEKKYQQETQKRQAVEKENTRIKNKIKEVLK